MSSIKGKRIASSIVRELSDIIHNEVNNENIKKITIVDAKVSNDLGYAKIYFTCPSECDEEFLLVDLKKASSFFRTELAHRLDLRSMPELRFALDESLEYGQHIESIIDSLHNK